ncbi:MAG: efflux RND transporter periplasmic adaptor subunit [Planctomycetes bacterium]|nr:efflux RND transporter periplasmic adaptor subunit [Planctomycetota bacterium]
MKTSTLVLLGLGIVLVGLVAYSALQPKAPTHVVIHKAEKLPTMRSVVKGTGEIRAKEFVDIQAEVAGLITQLNVREGDTVQKGQVLLTLDDLQLKAEQDSARAQVGASEADARQSDVGVATAEANLASDKTALANVKLEAEQARTSLERAKASFARKKELFDQKLIGAEEFEVAAAEARLAEQRHEWNLARIEQAQANLVAGASRVEAAKAVRDAACRRLESVQAGLARASDMVGKTVLKAPLSGLITKLNVEKGERAVPGIQSSPIATLMTIADMSVIEAEIRVAEADIVEVKLGAKAEVEVDAIRDVKFAGVVTEIGQSPIQDVSGGGGNNSSQEGKEFKVVVRLDAPSPDLRTGFIATAKITTAVRTDVLVVPFSAQVAREIELDEKGEYVRPKEPVPGEPEPVLTAADKAKRKEKEGVFVRRDGRAFFQVCEFGVVGEKMDVEVERGLQDGDEVISGPYQVLRTLKEWDRVELDPKRTKQGAGN